MDGKTKAIVAHLTIIGWIIALILNNQEKDEFASYYIRQVLGLFLLGIAGQILRFLGPLAYVAWVVLLLVFILWIISIVSAASDQMKPVPVVGDMFQKWFPTL